MTVMTLGEASSGSIDIKAVVNALSDSTGKDLINRGQWPAVIEKGRSLPYIREHFVDATGIDAVHSAERRFDLLGVRLWRLVIHDTRDVRSKGRK